MNKATKIGAGLLVGGVLVGTGYHYQRMYKAALELGFTFKNIGTPTVDIFKGAEIPLIVSVRNPVDKELNIGYPSIKFYFADGTQIATSIPKDEIFTIKPASETDLPITLKLTTSDVLTIGVSKMKAITSKLKGETIKMDVATYIKIAGLVKYDLLFTAIEKKF